MRVYYLFYMQKKNVRSMSRTKGIPNRYHALEFMLEMVREVLSGRSLRVVGEAHGVNLSVIRKWVSQYRQDGEAALVSTHGGSGPPSSIAERRTWAMWSSWNTNWQRPRWRSPR